MMIFRREIPDMQAPDDLQLSKLVAALCVESTAQDAQYSLQDHYGVAAVPSVLEVLSALSDFPRRCAIEFIQSCPLDALRERAGSSVVAAMIPLLKSGDDVTRSWTAETLGWLGDPVAIPALVEAREAAHRDRVPLDSSEQVSLRWALTCLGARTQVVPPLTAALMQRNATFEQCWPADVCERVVEDLAAADQVILYVSLSVKGTTWSGKTTYFCEPISSYELDLNLPWPQLVVQARDAALAATSRLTVRENRVMTVEWIDIADRS